LTDEVRNLKQQIDHITQENTSLKEMVGQILAQNQELKLSIDQKFTSMDQKIVSIDQKITSIDELAAKTTGIQQQLVVQSDSHNNLIQIMNQFKTTIMEKLDSIHQVPLQQQPVQQQISTQGVVINGSSSVVTSSHLPNLKEWITRPASLSHLSICRLDLLYKGSRDGFLAQNFHAKCDNKSPTICFIKSQTYGRIFGGYTEQTWNQTGGYKKDEKAFLFSLTHQEKYPVSNSLQAISCCNDWSVRFGGGCDIAIYDQCNTTSNNNWCHFPKSYKCSKFDGLTEDSKIYLAGSINYKVEEIEVYQIIWT